MRSGILALAVLATAALAASPPEKMHDPASLAEHVDVAPASCAVAPAVAALPAVEHASILEGFHALKASPSSIGTSPEVLEVARGCEGLQPFEAGALELAYLPRLRGPTWRFVAPLGSSGVRSAARG